MRHLEQTHIQPPSELSEEVEAEAEGSHDVREVQRNPGLLVRSWRENFPEEARSARGTCLVDID